MKKKKSLPFFLGLLVSFSMIMPMQVNADQAYRTINDADEIKAVSSDILAETKDGTIANADNYTFTSSMEGKLIKIKPEIDGTLCLDAGNTILDKNKKQLKLVQAEWDSCYYIKNVKKNDIYYVLIPQNFYKEHGYNFIVNAYVYPDNVSKIENNKTYIQSGQNRYTYKYFSIEKRTKSIIAAAPVLIDYKTHTYYYIQRKEKNRWKNVTEKQKGESDEHGKAYTICGLKKGQYRIATKTANDQFAFIRTENTSCTSKYSTKKKKAQKVKLKARKANIYTSTEKASRWYKIYRKTAKHKRYIKMKVQNNSGKVKFTIYKKGKALKRYTLSDGKSKTYRLKNGKGSYYIKVSKVGAKMNGQYTVQYK